MMYLLATSTKNSILMKFRAKFLKSKQCFKIKLKLPKIWDATIQLNMNKQTKS